jgi:hypothetical protein
MPSVTQTSTVSKTGLWVGRILSALLMLIFSLDGVVKLIKLAPAVEGTAKLGYPVSLVVPIGIVMLTCVALYMIPRTSILGAILLTGYLGGATATQVRVESIWFLFPVVLGVMVWGSLFFRDDRVRALIPLRSECTAVAGDAP